MLKKLKIKMMKKEGRFAPVGRCKGKGGSGVGVCLHDGESIESLIGRFKKGVIASGVLDDYKERGEFVKPSVKARLKKSMRKRRSRLSNIY